MVAVTDPSMVAATRAIGMFSGPVRKSAPTALAGGSVRRSSETTNRKMNAHSSTIDARINAVRSPRGIFARWRNVTSSSTTTSPVRAVTVMVRETGSPNHGRLPRSSISTGASPSWGITRLIGSGVQSISRVGSRASTITSAVVLPMLWIVAVKRATEPPVTMRGVAVRASAGAGVTVSQKSCTVWRSASSVDTIRTMTR